MTGFNQEDQIILLKRGNFLYLKLDDKNLLVKLKTKLETL